MRYNLWTMSYGLLVEYLGTLGSQESGFEPDHNEALQPPREPTVGSIRDVKVAGTHNEPDVGRLAHLVHLHGLRRGADVCLAVETILPNVLPNRVLLCLAHPSSHYCTSETVLTPHR